MPPCPLTPQRGAVVLQRPGSEHMRSSALELSYPTLAVPTTPTHPMLRPPELVSPSAAPAPVPTPTPQPSGRKCRLCGQTGHNATSCMAPTPMAASPAPRARREAAVKARTQLATALIEEAREAMDDALDLPSALNDGQRAMRPLLRSVFVSGQFLKVRRTCVDVCRVVCCGTTCCPSDIVVSLP